MDVETMPAGRELDALVAERVMGWVWVTFPGEHLLTGKRVLHQEIIPTMTEPAALDMPIHWPLINPPHYSTDIAAAWQLVEAMLARGHAFALQGYREAEPEWLARLGDEHAYAETAPLAICRAALKAVEEQANP